MYNLVGKGGISSPTCCHIAMLTIAFVATLSPLGYTVQRRQVEVEFYISHSQGHGVYYLGESIEFNIVAVNRGDASIPPSTIEYEIVDFYGNVIKKDTFSIEEIPAHSTNTYAVKISADENKTRSYCDIYAYWLSGTETISSARSSYCTIPKDIQNLSDISPFFGLCSGALFHLNMKDIPTVGERRLELHRRLGAPSGRNDLWWNEIEPEKGKFVWEKCDLVVETYKKYNLDLLGILCYYSSWEPNVAPAANAELLHYFANYAREVVVRYGKYVKYWEVWNEPNVKVFWQPQPNPKDYYIMLKSVYEAIKDVNKDAQVIGMVTSLCDTDFIDKVLSCGGDKYVDVISIHPYCEDGVSAADRVAEFNKIFSLRALLGRYNLSNLPIWVTEMGWKSIYSSGYVEGKVSFSEAKNMERMQAKYISQLYPYALAKGFIERLYYFNLSDWEEKDAFGEGHYGLLHADYTPKPSYLAYRTIIERIGSKKFISTVEVNKKDVHAYLFSGRSGAATEEVIILWSQRGKKTVILKLPVSWKDKKHLLIYDMLGNYKEIAVEGETMELKIDEEPIYVVAR